MYCPILMKNVRLLIFYTTLRPHMLKLLFPMTLFFSHIIVSFSQQPLFSSLSLLDYPSLLSLFQPPTCFPSSPQFFLFFSKLYHMRTHSFVASMKRNKCNFCIKSAQLKFVDLYKIQHLIQRRR